jgi:hypothetical protein
MTRPPTREKTEPGTLAWLLSPEQRTPVRGSVRTLVGIVSIWLSPIAALLGGLAGSFLPGAVAHAEALMDRGITWFWSALHLKQALAVSAAGVLAAVLCDPTGLSRALAALFALKLGADLGVRNAGKESGQGG